MPPGFFKNIFMVPPSVRIGNINDAYRRFLLYAQRIKELTRDGVDREVLDKTAENYLIPLANSFLFQCQMLISYDELQHVPKGPSGDLDTKAANVIRMMQRLQKDGYVRRNSGHENTVRSFLEKRPEVAKQLELERRQPPSYFEAIDALLLRPLSKLTGHKGPYVHARQARYGSDHYKRPRKRYSESDTEDDAMRE